MHWFLHQVDLTRHVLPSEETQPHQTQAVGSREEVGAPSSCGAGVSLGPIPSHWDPLSQWERLRTTNVSKLKAALHGA